MATKKKNTSYSVKSGLEDKENNERALQDKKAEGRREAYAEINRFLRERMISHFENQNDEMAKELRLLQGALTNHSNKV